MPRVVQWQYVGVLQPGQDTDLANEPQLSGLGAWVGVEHLERDPPFMSGVSREIDSSKRSLADLALDLVPPCESGSECGERVLRSRRSRHSWRKSSANISLPSRGCHS